MPPAKKAVKKATAKRITKQVAALRKAHNEKLLVLDAKNRALRSFMQGAGLDVLVAAAVFGSSLLSSTEAIDWKLQGALFGKTIAQTIFSYVMRRYMDPSKIPTPLPPDPPGEPDEDVD
jgi:hypothetical protein